MKTFEERKKRFGKTARKRPAVGGFFLMAAVALIAAGGVLLFGGSSVAGVAATKHNFGSLSGAAVKSSATTEICIFCHTPHNSQPSTPIWNKSFGETTYDIYASLTMVATLGQPTGSSKLCLTCHDGTIAIGSLRNLPGMTESGTLSVTGPNITDGKIASSNVSYIGVDLRNDHPISFGYDEFPTNAELHDRDTATMHLDSGNNIQCTSCHDPHGSNYPKFMVNTLQYGALCITCHNVRYWTGSAHKDSTATWNSSGSNPWYEDMGSAGYTDDSLALQGCMSCHRSHGGATNRFQLKGNGEEETCFACHNGNTAAKNMQTLFSGAAYKHDVSSVSMQGRHRPARAAAGDPAREGTTDLNNRHIECSDCHNSHGLKEGNHTVGGTNGNIIGNNLLGAWGVEPTWTGSPDVPAYTYTEYNITSLTPGSNNLEGYVCVKCHSYYAYGATPSIISGKLPDGTQGVESDITRDFNINNYGYHPVFAQGKNRPASNANPNWPANGLGLTNTFMYYEYPGPEVDRAGYWSITHDSKMTCSECHGSNSASNPKGPHGSSYKYIMRSNEIEPSGTASNVCYNCHRRDVYGDQDYVGPNANWARAAHPVDGLNSCPGAGCSPFYKSGATTGNNSNYYGNLCLTCHGGAIKGTSPNEYIQGIHGSHEGIGASPPSGAQELGKRLMNGACVEFYVPSSYSGSTNTEMYFKNATDKACKNVFSDFTNGVIANYDCGTAMCE